MLVATRDEVVVASADLVTFLPKYGAAPVAKPFPAGPIKAISGAPRAVYVAGPAVWSGSLSEDFAKVADLNAPTPIDMKAVWIGTNAVSSAQGTDPTDVFVASNAPQSTLRHVLIAPIRGPELIQTGCSGSNDWIRASALGPAVVAVASNATVVPCNGTPFTLDAVVDVAVVAPTVPPTFVVARTGANAGVERYGPSGLDGSFLHGADFEILRVVARAPDLFVLAHDAAKFRFELRRYTFGNDVGETLYSTSIPLVDAAVDATGVYVLDEVGSVYGVPL